MHYGLPSAQESDDDCKAIRREADDTPHSVANMLPHLVRRSLNPINICALELALGLRGSSPEEWRRPPVPVAHPGV